MLTWLPAVATGLALVATLGAAIAISRERALVATLEALRVGNQELRDLWEAERTARADSDNRHAVAMREQEDACAKALREHAEKVARLEGQVATLQSGIVGSLVSELKDALVDAVHAALNTPDRRTS